MLGNDEKIKVYKILTTIDHCIENNIDFKATISSVKDQDNDLSFLRVDHSSITDGTKTSYIDCEYFDEFIDKVKKIRTTETKLQEYREKNPEYILE